MTDHFLSPLATRLKQLAAEFFQVVQKPSLLSFQVPSPLTPALPSGCARHLAVGGEYHRVFDVLRGRGGERLAVEEGGLDLRGRERRGERHADTSQQGACGAR